MDTFHNLFRILSTGTPVQIKEAKRAIEQIWKTDHKRFKHSFNIISDCIETFDLIKNPINKAAVITGMSLFYLALSDTYFEVLKNFIVKNLQDPDGRVRESARKTGEWLYISLTDRTDPFIYPKGKDLSEKQVLAQQIARKQYADFITELEILIDKYCDDGQNIVVEYIDEMKPSVHKSLQQVWARLTDSRIYREIIEKSTPITLEIYEKRKEIENDLSQLLKDCKIGAHTTVDDIKQMIFEESDTEDFSDIIRMFDNGNVSNFDNALETISDAWKYFPHKILNGKCPFEMYQARK